MSHRLLIATAALCASACQCGPGPTANRAPTASILSPADGALLSGGGPYTLKGQAVDPEDGALGNSALTWNSSLLGPIGSGSSVTLTSPPLGIETILLPAVDSQGASGVASIVVRVVPVGANHPPVATITSPATGSSFTLGAAVTFTGSASD